MEPDVKALTAIAKEIAELRKAVERLTKTLQCVQAETCIEQGENTTDEEDNQP